MNLPKLKSIMALHSETVKDIADLIGVSPSSVYRKLEGTLGEFTQSEITKIKCHYQLTPEEVDEIFFTKKVS